MRRVVRVMEETEVRARARVMKMRVTDVTEVRVRVTWVMPVREVQKGESSGRRRGRTYSRQEETWGGGMVESRWTPDIILRTPDTRHQTPEGGFLTTATATYRDK